MKKLFFLALSFIFSTNLIIGQSSCMVSNMNVAKGLSKNTNSTTYFIGGDKNLHSIIESIWTVSQVKFVSRSKLESIAKEKEKSDRFYYVDLGGISMTLSDGTNTIGAPTSGLFLLPVLKSMSSSISRKYMLAATMRMYWDIREDSDINKELTILYLKNLNSTIDLINKKKIKCYVTCGMSVKLQGYYKNKNKMIREKSLVIPQNILSSNYTAAQLKGDYPHKVIIADEKQYLKLLKENSEKYLFWVKSETTDALLEGSTGECYYFAAQNTSKKESKLLDMKKSIKRLVSAI